MPGPSDKVIIDTAVSARAYGRGEDEAAGLADGVRVCVEEGLLSEEAIARAQAADEWLLEQWDEVDDRLLQIRRQYRERIFSIGQGDPE